MMEMMLTLMIVSIILSISLPHLPVYRQYNLADEIENISYVFQGAQMNALAKQESYTVFMEYNNQSITVRDKARTVISHYELHACRLEDFGMKQFSYRPSGDTSAFGTVYLSCGEKNVKFIFQILKGRFRIEQ